ncbi:uncharacterized protein LOC113555111 isoform X2 [Rhopalosiphum maidis]|uniref:uncharacterized protein LOC113555111 isoform X2 n=1 Tax=Rhopalosiphum maidis TaxID=43146 RepID=UPI000EFFC845|nr:uncharacterized protein LOC113555111 isoform X2 [Rhopalosiphum maidis]
MGYSLNFEDLLTPESLSDEVKQNQDDVHNNSQDLNTDQDIVVEYYVQKYFDDMKSKQIFFFKIPMTPNEFCLDNDNHLLSIEYWHRRIMVGANGSD